MIDYKKNIKDLGLYVKEAVKLACKPFIIIVSIFFPLFIFFLCVGIFDDKEALSYSYGLFVIIFIMLVFIIRMYLHYKKYMINMFRDANDFGDVEFMIKFVNGEYCIENLNSHNTTTIKKTDIKVITVTKKVIGVKTNLGQLFIFPKIDELCEFINNK